MPNPEELTKSTEQAMSEAVSQIRETVPHTSIDEGWEQEFYTNEERPQITVFSKISNVEEYQSIKDAVHEIVREVEPENVLIYTRVNRQK